MAISTINIGNQVNDGLGDDLRTAFEKVNANFSSLSTELTITASNVGDTGTGIFKQKTDSNLEFKKLVSGTKIFIEDAPNSIVVNSTSPDAFTRIDTNAGSLLADTFQQITLQGGDDIDVTVLGSVITVNSVIPVTKILQTYDFGPIVGNFSNTTQLALASSNIDFGTVTLPGRLDLDCGTIV
jgi:hypothetical protein